MGVWRLSLFEKIIPAFQAVVLGAYGNHIPIQGLTIKRRLTLELPALTDSLPLCTKAMISVGNQIN